MRMVALIGHGPNWIPGSVYEQGRPVQEHLEAMRDRYDEGSLLLGGPFESGRAGGIAVLEVPDRAAGEALMDADPAVRAGVMAYELHELRAYFDALDGTRSDGDVGDLPRAAQ